MKVPIKSDPQIAAPECHSTHDSSQDPQISLIERKEDQKKNIEKVPKYFKTVPHSKKNKIKTKKGQISNTKHVINVESLGSVEIGTSDENVIVHPDVQWT